MLEVPGVTETTEFAQNNQAGYELRQGGAEFQEVLVRSGLHEAGRKEVSVATGVLYDPDLMLPGGGIDLIAYDSTGHIQRISAKMGRRVDVEI